MKIKEAVQKVQDQYDTEKYAVMVSEKSFMVDCPVAHIEAHYVGKTAWDDDVDFETHDPFAIFRMGAVIQLNSMIGMTTKTEGFTVKGSVAIPEETEDKLLLTGACCLTAAIIAVHAGYDVDLSHDVTDTMSGKMVVLKKK